MYKMSNAPERHCKKWEDDEVQYVLGRVKQNIHPGRIAEEVKRTPGAIVAQLKKIACDSVERGMSLEDAAELTKLPIEIIEDSIQRRKFAEQIKEERKNHPPEPKQAPLRPFFLNKQETEMDILIEIRELLRELVKSKQIAFEI
jgi:hypothetical protein